MLGTPMPSSLVDDIVQALRGAPTSPTKALGQSGTSGKVIMSVPSSKGKIEFDAFLSHDWGCDGLDRDNHKRVSRANDS